MRLLLLLLLILNPCLSDLGERLWRWLWLKGLPYSFGLRWLHVQRRRAPRLIALALEKGSSGSGERG
jgi:hypothetical protein